MTEPVEQILQFFKYDHLPPHLAEVSAPFATLADHLVHVLPRNAERTVALRKLLESKDAAVRAKLATPVPWAQRESGLVDPSEYKQP